jgi:prolyl 4-hydroxylase
MNTHDAAELANHWLARGNPSEAIRIITERVKAGDPSAQFQRGLWQLIGAPLPRDLAAARIDFQNAANRGHVEAQMVDIALTANGTGSVPNWSKARIALERFGPSNPHAAVVQRLLVAMDLDAEGLPRSLPEPEVLATGSSILRFPSLLTREECEHVARAAADLLEPAVIADPRTGRNIPHPIRTSDGAVIGPVREDLAIRAINQRVAAVSETHIEQGEALTLLRYHNGQQFRMHSDALPHARNQRVKTVLIYLNEGFRGGETVFPDYDLTIAPRIGDAIVFANTLDDGRPDPSARHAGLPVTFGTKWLATRWIRAHRFNVWSGPDRN